MAELKICPLKSSSKGNATVIYNKKTKILVDCGISGKVLEECLKNAGILPQELAAVVVTHEHTDHTKGVGVISRKLNIPVFATSGTWQGIKGSLGKIDPENIQHINVGECFYIKDIKVQSFEIPHDAKEPVGYVFESNGERVAVATDMGRVSETVLEVLKGCRAVLLEANYDPFMLDAGSYPYELKRRIRGDYGHLCNDDSGIVAKILAQSGTAEIILGHMSEENNFPQIALETVKACLEGMEVKLSAACLEGVIDCRKYSDHNI